MDAINEGRKPKVEECGRYGLLAIAFLMPIGTLLPTHSYRVIELAIFILCFVTLGVKGGVQFPPLINYSFWIGLAGWVVSTVASPDTRTSIDIGTLEFLGFYALLYLSAIYLRERRYFVIAINLFIAGFLIQSLYQAWFVLTPLWDDGRFRSYVPILASDLINYKNGVPFFFPHGIPNTYGNIGNYVSLWTLVIPVIIGLLYTKISKFIVWPIIVVALWCGLIVYSRAGVLSIVLAIAALWTFRAIVLRVWTPSLLAIVVVLIGIHVQPNDFQYYMGGVTSFIGPAVAERYNDAIDASGALRAQAFRNGIEISLSSFPAGIGYGIYPKIEPAITSPHNLALHRLAEAGLLGLLSFLFLVLYAPIKFVEAVRQRDQDTLKVHCLAAVSAFMFKAVLFGATFSISSNIVWAFGAALFLTPSITATRRDATNFEN